MSVLLCYDGSPDARRAIDAAGSLLAPRRATVLHVSKSFADWWYWPKLGSAGQMPELDNAVIASAQVVLDDGVRVATEAGFETTGELRTTGTAVWRTVLDVAHETDATLIGVGTHGHRLRTRLGMGSVTRGLASQSDVPLLITPPAGTVSRTRSQRRILVALDGSPMSAEILARVASAMPGAATHIVCGWRDPDIDPMSTWVPTTVFEDKAEEISVAAVDKAREFGLDATAEARTTTGSIAEFIIESARRMDADAIAVGTHGHGFVTRAVLGSTALAVIDLADRPVFMIPPAEG